MTESTKSEKCENNVESQESVEKHRENTLTSKEWFNYLGIPESVVLDPDGWDRQNYEYSYYEEKITLDEFRMRIYKSTLYLKGKSDLKLLSQIEV